MYVLLLISPDFRVLFRECYWFVLLCFAFFISMPSSGEITQLLSWQEVGILQGNKMRAPHRVWRVSGRRLFRLHTLTNKNMLSLHQAMLEDAPFPNLAPYRGDHEKSRCFQITTIGFTSEIPRHEKKGVGVLPKPLSNHWAFPHPEAEVAFQHVQMAAA